MSEVQVFDENDARDIFELCLAPLLAFLRDPSVIEVLVNRPREALIERAGARCFEHHALPTLDAARLHRIARLIAGASRQYVNAASPLLSATLSLPAIGPQAVRVQIVLPPLAPDGPVLAFRRYVLTKPQLSAFTARLGEEAPAVQTLPDRRSDPMGFLAACVKARRTILISGATSSGKTTLMNALIGEIAPTERLVTIEDAAELAPPQASHVRLIVSRGDQGEARANAIAALEAALRLRPDRILMGELRGAEAAAFLRAINTGHPGSLATIHADSPSSAYEQIALMALQAGVMLARAELIAYVKSLVPIVVQCAQANGRRGIVAIEDAADEARLEAVQ